MLLDFPEMADRASRGTDPGKTGGDGAGDEKPAPSRSDRLAALVAQTRLRAGEQTGGALKISLAPLVSAVSYGGFSSPRLEESKVPETGAPLDAALVPQAVDDTDLTEKNPAPAEKAETSRFGEPVSLEEDGPPGGAVIPVESRRGLLVATGALVAGALVAGALVWCAVVWIMPRYRRLGPDIPQPSRRAEPATGTATSATPALLPPTAGPSSTTKTNPTATGTAMPPVPATPSAPVPLPAGPTVDDSRPEPEPELEDQPQSSVHSRPRLPASRNTPEKRQRATTKAHPNRVKSSARQLGAANARSNAKPPARAAPGPDDDPDDILPLKGH
jgi:hypothetical protein